MAQTLYDEDPSKGPVTICDVAGIPRWHPIWSGNPVVKVPKPPLSLRPDPYIRCGQDCLPYIRYPRTTKTKWEWSDWRVRDHRPKLYLSKAELHVGKLLERVRGPFILLEPTAQRKSKNRRPPRAFWGELLTLLKSQQDLPIVQLAHQDAELLGGVHPAPHADFREACGVLSHASLLICTEGGLAHAAAALGIPAVVLWGGNVSVEALGYPEQTNLVDPSQETPCGALYPCDHCARAWEAITPDIVMAAIHHTLRGVPHGVS